MRGTYLTAVFFFKVVVTTGKVILVLVLRCPSEVVAVA